MRPKRGQLTLFVIIAIVVVICIIGYFFVNKDLNYYSVDTEVKPVYDAVISCINDVSAESIEVVGESGGYYNTVPEKVDPFYVSYYFYDGVNLMPNLSFIENEMSMYVSDLVPFCVKKRLNDLPDYEFYSGEINVDVNINSNDKVYFKVNYPFSVIKNERSYYFDKTFSVVHNVRLFSIYEFISKIMVFQEKEPRAFCVNCIGDSAKEYGFYIDLYTLKPNDVTFYVTDPSSLINNEPYMFFFVVKYPENNFYDPFEDL